MKKKVLENIVKWIFLLCGIAAVGFVLCICLYLVISGVPAIREIGLWNFLFGETWNAPTNEFGILPFILTSIYGTAGALLLGVPLGLFTAVFLAKAAPPRIAAAARSCVALLAGIPSVVYGLVGMTVLVPFVQKSFSLSSGACLLTAILVLTNTDRHLNNFGVLRNSRTLKFVRMAPIFDSGNSMFWDAPRLPERSDCTEITVNSFRKTETELLKLVTDRSRVHMDLLPGRNEIAELYAKDDSIAFVDSILTGYEKKKALLERFMEKGIPAQTHRKRNTEPER